MSEQPLPASDREQTGEGKQPNQEQAENYETFFRFRPVACLKYYAGRCHARASKNEKGDYLGAAIGFSVYVAVACWPLWVFLVVLLVAAARRAVANADKFDSNQVIAGCTAALVLVAIVQWWTSSRQHRQMEIQNGYIERQTQIAESQVEQMRLEQRAWLSAAQPQMWTFATDRHIQVLVKLKNTGNTPAKIVDTAIKILELPAHADMKALNLDSAAAADNEIRNCVAPSDTLSIRTKDDTPFLNEDLDRGIRDETIRLWVFGKVFYRDVIEEELRKTVFCYYWEPRSKQFYAHDKINDME